MITYKIYPMPGICDRALTGALGTEAVRTVGDLLRAASGREDTDFLAGVDHLALLDGKPLDVRRDRDRRVEDGSELVVLPAIMGG